MPLPRSVARFNKRWTNRLMEPIAKKARGFAIVHHVGRRSGRSYSTPINTFHHDEGFLVAMTYGRDADWYLNVLGGPAQLEFRGERLTIVKVEPVDRPEAVHFLPLPVRIATRLIGVTDFAWLRVDSGT